MLRMSEVPTPEVEPSAGGTSEATNSATGEGGLQHGQVQPSSGRSSPLSHIEHLGEGAQRLHGQVQPSSGTSSPLSHMKHLGEGAERQHGQVQHGQVQDPSRHERMEYEGEVFDKNNHQITTDNTNLQDLLAHNIMSLNAEYGGPDGWLLPSDNLGALLSPPWECMQEAARVGEHAGAADVSRAAPGPTPADVLPADDHPAGTALEPTTAGTLSADGLLRTAVASVASESDRLLPTAQVFLAPADGSTSGGHMGGFAPFAPADGCGGHVGESVQPDRLSGHSHDQLADGCSGHVGESAQSDEMSGHNNDQLDHSPSIEFRRNANIVRNNKRLADLGLDRIVPKSKPRRAAAQPLLQPRRVLPSRSCRTIQKPTSASSSESDDNESDGGSEYSDDNESGGGSEHSESRTYQMPNAPAPIASLTPVPASAATSLPQLRETATAAATQVLQPVREMRTITGTEGGNERHRAAAVETIAQAAVDHAQHQGARRLTWRERRDGRAWRAVWTSNGMRYEAIWHRAPVSTTRNPWRRGQPTIMYAGTYGTIEEAEAESDRAQAESDAGAAVAMGELASLFQVADDTGTIIEQLTGTATQLDDTEDVLEQLNALDGDSVGADPAVAAETALVAAGTALVAAVQSPITPSAYALVGAADMRLGAVLVAAVGRRDARLEAAQKAIDEELHLHPTMSQQGNNSGTNSTGFRYVKLLTRHGNSFQATLLKTPDRVPWYGPTRSTPEEASLDVARRLRDFPSKSQASLHALSATALQQAASEKLGLLLKGDDSFYGVTEKPSRKKGGGFLSSRRASV